MTALATPDPNAVRIAPAVAPSEPSHSIGVHLTPFAPDCAHLWIADPKRWRRFWGKDASAVLRSLLQRLQAQPSGVRLETWVNGDIALIAGVEADLIPDADTPDPEACVALVTDGATQDQLQAALDELIRVRWRPILFHPGKAADDAALQALTTEVYQ